MFQHKSHKTKTTKHSVLKRNRNTFYPAILFTTVSVTSTRQLYRKHVGVGNKHSWRKSTAVEQQSPSTDLVSSAFLTKVSPNSGSFGSYYMFPFMYSFYFTFVALWITLLVGSNAFLLQIISSITGAYTY